MIPFRSRIQLSNAFGKTQQLTDSDATYDAFFTGCLQNPQYCALAGYNSTAKELQNTIEKLLEEVKYQPIVLGSDISTDLVTYQSLRLLIASAIYATSLWPDLAQAFDAVFTRNQTSYVEASTVLTGALGARLYPQYAGPENLQGIRCSDSAFRTDEFSEVSRYVQISGVQNVTQIVVLKTAANRYFLFNRSFRL